MITNAQFNHAVKSKIGCVVEYYVKQLGYSSADAYRFVCDCHVTSVLKNKRSRLYLEDIYFVIHAYEMERLEGKEAADIWLDNSIGG